jgi:hypothetical protein
VRFSTSNYQLGKVMGVFFGSTLVFAKNLYSGFPSFFMGDDLGWVTAVQLETHQVSHSLASLTAEVSGKWRPLAQFFMGLVIRASGLTPLTYFVASSILLALVACVASDLFVRLSKPLSPLANNICRALLITAIMCGAPADLFTFSPFSVMELPPALLSLLALNSYLRVSHSHRTITVQVVFMVWVSALFHERYLVFVLVVWILTVLEIFDNSRDSKRLATAFGLNAGITVAYCCLKTQVIGVPFIAAGGESSIEEGLSLLGLFRRLSDGLVAALGSNGVASIYYWSDGRPLLLHKSLFNEAIALAIFVFIVFGLFSKSSKSISVSESRTRRATECSDRWVVIAIGIASLIPGITVVSRIEARWLFLSWILFLVLAVASSVSISPRVSIALLLVAGIASANPSFTRAYRDIHQTQTDRLIERVERVSETWIEPQEHWDLSYINRRISGYWDTQNSILFQRINRPPSGISLGQIRCDAPKCLLVIQYPNDTDVIRLQS